MSSPDDTSRPEIPSNESDGARGSFNTTDWSAVLLAGQDSPEAAPALEQLCRAYWFPLYAYVRRQGQGPADGQDLTQQFFTIFLEKKYFGLANPEPGRFRSILQMMPVCSVAKRN